MRAGRLRKYRGYGGHGGDNEYNYNDGDDMYGRS